MSGLEAAIDALYALPLGDFIVARAELAKRARSEDRERAAEIKALPKPNAAAWAINQLYWHDRASFERLTRAGERMRKVQAQALAGAADPGDLRDAQRDEREIAKTLVAEAAQRLEASGQSASASTLERVEQTLHAIAALGAWPGEPGRLTRELAPPGLEALSALPSEPAHLPEREHHDAARRGAHAAPERAEEHAPASERARDRDRDRQRAAEQGRRERIELAERALADATAEVRRAKRDAETAARAHEQATAKAASRRRDAEDAERRAERARSAADEAEQAALDAEKEATRTSREISRAEAARDHAQAALAKLRHGDGHGSRRGGE